MIALTVMAASAGLALSNLAANARAEIAGGLTVQIVQAAPVERHRQAPELRAPRADGGVAARADLLEELLDLCPNRLGIRDR